MPDNLETKSENKEFDRSAYPADTIFVDRRSGIDRRDQKVAPPEILERRKKPERRRRIDPTTFDKSYTKEEIEFGTEMVRYMTCTGKRWPNAAETLNIVYSLGYRKLAAHSVEVSDDFLLESA